MAFGPTRAASIPIMIITTRISMRVNPRSLLLNLYLIGSPLKRDFIDAEDGQQHRNDDETDHRSHDENDKRFQKRNKPFHRSLNILFVGLSDFDQHLVQSSRFFSDTDHVDRKRRENVSLFQRLGDALSFPQTIVNVVDGSRYGEVLRNLLHQVQGG